MPKGHIPTHAETGQVENRGESSQTRALQSLRGPRALPRQAKDCASPRLSHVLCASAAAAPVLPDGESRQGKAGGGRSPGTVPTSGSLGHPGVASPSDFHTAWTRSAPPFHKALMISAWIINRTSGQTDSTLINFPGLTQLVHPVHFQN